MITNSWFVNEHVYTCEWTVNEHVYVWMNLCEWNEQRQMMIKPYKSRWQQIVDLIRNNRFNNEVCT